MKIKKIFGKNAIIFMWTTGPFLGKAIELGESWGFEYVTMFLNWFKDSKKCLGFNIY